MTVVVQLPVVGAYRVDVDESTISFTTKHMFGLGTVRGTFALREGRIDVAEQMGASTVRATVAADSVDTGVAARDQAVRSATYLDAERFPDFAFVSSGVERAGERWVLRGALTVRGVSRPVDVLVEEAQVTGDRLRVVATAEVDRYAFGITAMRGMTGRRLSLRLEIFAGK
jgi:polyisoprenoid-binding protein YceI